MASTAAEVISDAELLLMWDLVEVYDAMSLLRQQLPTPAMLESEYNVLRLNQDELTKLQSDIVAKCDNGGIWQGAISGSRKSYPTILRRCRIGMEDMERGTRKNNAVMFTCSHVILVSNGHKPFNHGVQASHLSHTLACLNVKHLRWELRHVNEKRNRCIGQPCCLCGQTPSCLPSAHVSHKIM